MTQGSPPVWLTPHRVIVLGGVVAGILLVSLIAISGSVPAPERLLDPSPIWMFMIVLIMSLLSEFIYVPVRHSDSWEDLTFAEITVVVSILTLPNIEGALLTAIGFSVGEMFARRPLVKKVFNIVSLTMSVFAFHIVYMLLIGNAEVFGAWSITTLIISAAAYGLVELTLLSMVLYSADGLSPITFFKEEVLLSSFMVIGSVGVSTIILMLISEVPAIAVFAVIPLASMWYSYRTSSENDESKEHSQWVVLLGQELSNLEPSGSRIPTTINALARAYRAEDYSVVMPDGRHFGEDPDWVPPDSIRGIQPLEPGELPKGWVIGSAFVIGSVNGDIKVAIGCHSPELGESRIPWSRTWRIDDTEVPGFLALKTSIEGSLRSAHAFSELTSETSKLQAVVDNVTDGICVVDDEGDVLLWSPAAVGITGIESARGDTSPILGEIISVPEGESRILTFDRVDGQTIDVQVTKVPMDIEGQTSVISLRDMTRERRAERLKADFIATVSHELRTPITPIRGYADLLKRRSDRIPAGRRNKMLQTIEEKADHLTALVDDLLIAARRDDQLSVDVQSSRMDVAQIVRSVVEGFRLNDDRVRYSGPETLIAIGDPSRVRQIIENLIGNALKYAPDTPTIDVRSEETTEHVSISVTDYGPGIVAHEQERIFEQFYRIEDPLTMRTGGSGLGLHIARTLARSMEGDVTVRSTPGHETTFTLHLVR